MIKRLRDIITEKYPEDYELKTKVGRSFVALHKDNKKIDKLGDKGGTEAQFKADGVEVAPHNRAPQDGFPADGQDNDYNLRTYYDKADQGEEDYEDDDYEYDDNDVDNDTTRARIAHSEEKVDEKRDSDWDPIDPKDERIGDEGHKPKKKKVKEEVDRLTFLQLMGEWNKREELKKAEKTLEAGRFRKKKVKEETEQLDEQSLTRKHFREVANTVRAIEDPKERQKFAEHHAGIFAKANPRFSFQKFHDACGTKSQLNDAPRKA